MKQALMLSLFLIGFLSAQESETDSMNVPSSTEFSFNGGFGLGFYKFYYNVGVMYHTEYCDYALRYLASRELVVELAFSGAPGFKRPIENIREVEFLIGRKLYSKEWSVSLYSGISSVGGTFRGNRIPDIVFYTEYKEYEHLDKIVLGIPIEARLAFAPSHYVDVGISFFTNINRKKTYRSFTLSIQLATPL